MQKSSDKFIENQRDSKLFQAIGILNIASATTTIQGAKSILPNSFIAITTGSGIQLLLLFLLSGFTLNHAPKRKWTAALILSFFSIYTSFFSYYGELTKDLDKQNKVNKAINAHANLKLEVLTSMENSLRLKKEKADEKQKLFKGEETKGLDSGNGGGYGDNARKLEKEFNDASIAYENLKSLINQLRPKFEYDIEGLNANEIYRKDLQAFSSVDKQYHNGYQLKQSDYIDQDLEIAFTTPFNQLKKFNTNAIASIIMAILLDGLIIMLSTAIIIKPLKLKKSIFEKFANKYSRFVREKKSYEKTISIEKNKPAQSYTTSSDLEQLKIPLDIIEKFGKKPQVFLIYLYKATDYKTFKIDSSFLKKQGEGTYIIYTMLLDRLRSPGLEWVKHEQGTWIVEEKHHNSYTNWLQNQIIRYMDKNA